MDWALGVMCGFGAAALLFTIFGSIERRQWRKACDCYALSVATHKEQCAKLTTENRELRGLFTIDLEEGASPADLSRELGRVAYEAQIRSLRESGESGHRPFFWRWGDLPLQYETAWGKAAAAAVNAWWLAVQRKPVPPHCEGCQPLGVFPPEKGASEAPPEEDSCS